MIGAVLAMALTADGPQPSSRALLEVLDRLTREANFRNSEVNDGKPETNLQMPLRATAYPGLCSQDVIRIRNAGMSIVTLNDIATTTNYLAIGDPRPRNDAPDSAYYKDLDAQCRKIEIANGHAADAFTAWVAAYAVALVRAELEKPKSPVLDFSCDEAPDSCEQTVLLQVLKADDLIRASLADCGADRCVKVGGFYDAYAAKVRNKAVFLTMTARFDRDGPRGVGALKRAEISQESGN